MSLRTSSRLNRGFTLVEMMVIAPIVILLIGSFIALIVNLTGEVMSSRGANVVAYDLQDALNRIESDVKLSTTYLATTNIDVSTSKQGYSNSPSPNGGTAAFTNIDKSGSGGSYQSIILNSLVTDGNPLSNQTNLIYLANQPNTCDEQATYSKNTPMTMNVVYFIDNTNTLWRRVIMPSNYTDTAAYCGTNPPWQLPSCINGYNATALPFCKATDEKLLTDISPNDFSISYYSAASSTTPDSIASNPSITDDTMRGTALLSTPTISVSLTARKTVAGRDIVRSGTLRATRLDTNATSIAKIAPVTAAPAAPTVGGSVSDGHNVTFTWPRVAGATSYTLEYQINGGAWQMGANNLDNNTRSYTVTDGTHTDVVNARVRAFNSFGPSGYGTSSITIPLWAPLLLKGNWTDYANGYSTAGYTKTKSGFVILKGLVKNSGSPAAWDVIGSLPSDYLPAGRLIFGTSSSSNVSARVDVDQDGNVLFGTGGSPAWISLETIRYIPTSTSLTKTAATFQNGFTNYGGTYTNATYARESTTGRVFTEGLINFGTNTDNTTMFNVPSTAPTYASPLYLHLATYAGGGFAHLGADPTKPAIVAKGTGGSSWISVNTTYLSSSSSATWNNLTFQNSWTNYGGVFATGQYTKTSDNVVQLKGLIKGGSTTYDTPIATLPAGFRPKSRILYTTVGNVAYARVDVYANGEIHFMGSSNTWYSLDDILFMAEQ